MTDARKYSDREVREIFALASSGEAVSAPAVPTQEGLTLSEIQDVGREVGLEPERVAHAALALETRDEMLPRETTIGMPRSVGRIVELPEALTEEQWELLVAEMGHTFGGVGTVTNQGRLRQWSNGSVHAFLEPTETGYRLRLMAANESAAGVNAAGGILLVFGLVLLAMIIAAGELGAELFIPSMFILAGGGALAANVIRLPRWAGEQEEQMDYIARRANALIASNPP